MLRNGICFTEATPLLPSLQGMADDKVPHNESSVVIANPLWKDIPVVTIVVTT